MSKEFEISQSCGNAVNLSVRCQDWSIMREDGEDLTDDDLEFLKNIEAVLNANSKCLLPAPDDDEQ